MSVSLILIGSWKICKVYRDPVQALRAANKAMATDTCVTTQVWNDMLGGSIKEKSDLTKWDRICQGVYTFNLAKKSARLYTRYLLEAVYYPSIQELKAPKELSCKMVSQYVYEQLDKRIDRWFIDDITRKYCGLNQRHNDQWWADHLHRSDRQVRRYKNEKIHPVLDGLHDMLIEDIENPFIENGLIKR